MTESTAKHTHQADLLKAVLKKGESLLIFTHNNPDPDAIASAYMLDLICKSLGKRSKIVYGGLLTRSENKMMVNLLKIPLYRYKDKEEKEFDHLALVDTQAHASNNVFPKDVAPLITFDHHTNTLPKRNFCLVNTTAGATATLVLPIYLKMNLPLTENVANAYCYAITAETRDLGRGATDTDVLYYQKIFSKASPVTLSKIRYAKKSVEFYDVLKNALSLYHIENHIASCVLGKIPSPEYVSEIADTLLNIAGVTFTIVAGKTDETTFISTRTSYEDIKMEAILNEAIGDRGGCGGHDMIAAGSFKGNPRPVVKRFIKIIKSRQ
jgi:nanoRNase/pAp phosphatase (c-di-AMP/oligoRNAs hydrolase)